MSYQKIPFDRFVIGLIVVSIPLYVLTQQGEISWAWKYTVLILVMLLVFHYPGIQSFTKFIQGV